MAVDDEIRRRKKIVLLGLLVTLFLLTAGALPLMTRQERTPTATALVRVDPATPAVQATGLTPVSTLVASSFQVTAARPVQASASPTPVVVDKGAETGGESQDDGSTPRPAPTSSRTPTVEATSVVSLQSRATATSQEGDTGTSPTDQAKARGEPEPDENGLDREGRERDERDERSTATVKPRAAESTAESESANPTVEVTVTAETGATAAAETIGRETGPSETTATSEPASSTTETTATAEIGETAMATTEPADGTAESEPASPTAETTATAEAGVTATVETKPSESTAESEPASPTAEVTATAEAGATAEATGPSESTATSELASPTVEVTVTAEAAVAEAAADPADELQVEPPEADPNIAEHMRGEMDEPAQFDNQTVLATAASSWPDGRAEAIALAKESQAAGNSRPASADIPPENLPVTGVRMAQTNWGIIGLAFGIVFLLALFGMAAVGSTTDQPD